MAEIVGRLTKKVSEHSSLARAFGGNLLPRTDFNGTVPIFDFLFGGRGGGGEVRAMMKVS